MEQSEVTESSANSRSDENRLPMATAASRSAVLMPQLADAPCPTCGTANATGDGVPAYVYGLGRLKTYFPFASVEKEFAQATGRADTVGKTDHEAFYAVLSRRENRYLARQLCWVFLVQGVETYIVRPRDPADYDLLIDAIKGPLDPNPWISLLIGVRGPVASPDVCNGLMVPVVVFDQLYSFDYGALIKAIPRPEKMTEKQFAPAAEELFSRVMQMTDNAGARDEDRAVNYVAMRYQAVYQTTAYQYARDFSLSGLQVQLSPLSGTRKIVDVIFVYTNRNTDFVEKFFVRVDVTEEFPFLVTKMAPYYDR